MNPWLRAYWRHVIKWPSLLLSFAAGAWFTVLLSPATPHPHVPSLAARVLVCAAATTAVTFITLPGIRYFAAAWLVGPVAGGVARSLGASAAMSDVIRVIVMLPLMVLFAVHLPKAAKHAQGGPTPPTARRAS